MKNFLIIGNYFGVIISIIFFIIFSFIDKKLNKARNFVMVGLFLFGLSFLLDVLRINGSWTSARILNFIYFPLFFSIYPLIFHYILNLTNNSSKVIIEKNKFIIPIVLLVIILFAYLFYGKIEIGDFILKNDSIYAKHFKIYDFILFLLIIFYYLQVAYYIFRFIQFQNEIYEIKNSLYLKRWIKYITIGLIIFEFVSLLSFILQINFVKIDIIVSILFVVFLGIIGIKHNEILLSMKITNGFKQHAFDEITKRKRPSHISPQEIKKILENMDRIISVEKLYLDPNLKLRNLARKIHIPEKELSILINDHFNKNFTTYINNFRIDEAKSILKKKSEDHMLENLYADVGFFTRSTFNRVFKAITNVTPSEYKKRNF